jgi:hypothetical protein
MERIPDSVLRHHLLPMSSKLRLSGATRFIEDEYESTRLYPIGKELDPENELNNEILVRAIYEEDVRTVDVFRRYLAYLMTDDRLDFLNEILTTGTFIQIKLLFSVYSFDEKAGALIIGYINSKRNDPNIIPVEELTFMVKFFGDKLEIRSSINSTTRKVVFDEIRKLLDSYISRGYDGYYDLSKILNEAHTDYGYVLPWTTKPKGWKPYITNTESSMNSYQDILRMRGSVSYVTEPGVQHLTGPSFRETRRLEMERVQRNREIDLEAEKIRSHFEKLSTMPALVDEEEVDFYDMNYGDEGKYQEEGEYQEED